MKVVSSRAATSDLKIGRRWVGARLLAHQNNWGGGARGLGRPLKVRYERDIFCLVFGAGCVYAGGTKVRLRRDKESTRASPAHKLQPREFRGRPSPPVVLELSRAARAPKTSENFQPRFVSRQSASALEVVSSRAATSDLKIGRTGVGARLLALQNNWGGGERGLGRPLKVCHERDIFCLVFGAGCV